jgi:hypothetical protein
MTPTQRADIETALDQMALALTDAGLMTEPLRAKYTRAIQIAREVPPGIRRIRKDHSACMADPQHQIPEVV